MATRRKKSTEFNFSSTKKQISLAKAAKKCYNIVKPPEEIPERERASGGGSAGHEVLHLGEKRRVLSL